jgi:excisionase family DNA binding protein
LSLETRRRADSAFWVTQARRFQHLRDELLRIPKRPLGASFHPDGWGLDVVRAFRGRTADRWLLDNGTPAAVEEFKSIACVCAVALGALNIDSSWAEWLDCLRHESTDFKPGELSLSSMPHEWRPEPDLEIVVGGLIYEPLDVFPDADAEPVTTELSEIDDACLSSERACRRLADEALKAELTDGNPETTVQRRPDAALAPAAPDRSKTLTLREASDALRVSEDTLHRMRATGAIEMFKVGSRWRVRASEVIRLREQPKFANR